MGNACVVVFFLFGSGSFACAELLCPVNLGKHCNYLLGHVRRKTHTLEGLRVLTLTASRQSDGLGLLRIGYNFARLAGVELPFVEQLHLATYTAWSFLDGHITS